MTSINLMDVIKEPGVSNLPLSIKGPFAKALIAERKGDMVEAERQLNLALDAEAKAKNAR